MILLSYPLKLTSPLTLAPWDQYQIPLCVVRPTSDPALFVAQSVTWLTSILEFGGKAEAAVGGDLIWKSMEVSFE